ncbi:hypothetical protein [Pedobacter deserti]|uniref:hypothetical protein n=1 Tax=Pedobacter deserti TaxID=2817382 RepID=UPI00210EB789|nr:hypothetical protein [Pedobacter sp. SYSU D00382]
MKTKLTLIFLALCLTASAQLPSKALLDMVTLTGLKNEIKPGYGTTLQDPICTGAFLDISNTTAVREKMFRLMNSYRWADGSKLNFSKRVSYTRPDGSGITDCYMIPKPGTSDTLRLYVDPYKNTDIHFIPEGLAMLSLATIGKEISPYVEEIKAIEAASDAFILKEASGKILQYISNTFALAGFLDRDALQIIADDKQANAELKGFLVRAYILNKFYAYAHNLPEPQKYAFEKMKENFAEITKAHPDLTTGNLSAALR